MAWYDNSWGYRVKVTISNTQVDATLTDFPVYIDLSDLPATFHTNVNSDGGDIRVTTSDEITEVPREVVFYNSTTDTGELYFKAPSLSSTTDTDFYIYFGNSGATDYVGSVTYGYQNVWTNNYVHVWHLHENTGTSLPDSSPSSLALTKLGALEPTPTVGIIGSAQNFDGSNDYMFGSVTSDSSYTGSITLSVWANIETGAQYRHLMGKHLSNGGADNPFDFRTSNAATPALTTVRANTGNRIYTGPSVNLGSWAHYVFTHPGALEQAGSFYVNGVPTISGISGTGTGLPTGTGAPLRMGIRHDGVVKMDGGMDEIRITSDTKSSAWIAAEYNNQQTPTSFYTVASTESVPTGSVSAIYGTGVYGTSYYGVAGGTSTIKSDITITKEFVSTVTTNSTIQKTGALDIVSDSFIQKDFSTTIKSDLTITTTESDSIVSNISVLQTFSSDISSTSTTVKSFTSEIVSDINILIDNSNTINSSVSIEKIFNSSIDSGVSIEKGFLSVIESNTFIVKEFSSTITSSQHINSSQTKSIDSSLDIAKTISTEIESNATITKTITKTSYSEEVVDTFEDGDYTTSPEWVVNSGSWSVTSSHAKNGTYGLKAAASGSIGHTHSTPQTLEVGEFSTWIKITSAFGCSAAYQVRDENSNYVYIEFENYSYPYMKFWRNTTGTLVAWTPTLNAWYKFIIAFASNGRVSGRIEDINGTVVAETPTDYSHALTTYERIILSSSISPTESGFAFDDVTYAQNIINDGLLCDAHILANKKTEILSTSSIRKNLTKTIASNSFIASNESLNVLSNTYISKTLNVSVNSNAHIQIVPTWDITTDAVVLKTVSTIIPSDMNVFKTFYQNIVSDISVVGSPLYETFEDGNFTLNPSWTVGAGNPIVTTDDAHTGSYSVKFDDTVSYASLSVSRVNPETHIGSWTAWIKPTSNNSTGDFYQLYDSNGSFVVLGYFLGDFTIADGGPPTYGSSLSTGSWYKFEASFTENGSYTGSVLDESENLISAIGPRLTPIENIKTIELQSRSGYFDDILVSKQASFATINSKLISSDTIITKTLNSTTVSNTNISKTFSDDVVGDSHISKQLSENITSQANIVITEQSDISSDQTLRKSFSETIISESVLSKVFSETISSGLVVTTEEDISIVSDSHITKSLSHQISSDSVVAKSFSESVLSSAHIKDTFSSSIDSNTFIRQIYSNDIVSDTHIKSTIEQNIVSRAFIVKDFQTTIVSDLVIYKADITATIDSVSAITKQFSESIDLNTHIKRIGTETTNSSSHIRDTFTESVVSDAVIVETEAVLITSQSHIIKPLSENISSDTTVAKTTTDSITSDSVIQITENEGVLSDSTIRVVENESITTNSVIVKTSEESIYSNASIFTETSRSIVSNVLITKERSETVFTNVTINTLETSTISSDLNLFKVLDSVVVSDTNILTKRTEEIATDTTIQYVGSETTSSDLTIRLVNSTDITSSAYIVQTVIRTVVSDAVIMPDGFVFVVEKPQPHVPDTDHPYAYGNQISNPIGYKNPGDKPLSYGTIEKNGKIYIHDSKQPKTFKN